MVPPPGKQKTAPPDAPVGRSDFALQFRIPHCPSEETLITFLFFIDSFRLDVNDYFQFSSCG
jgi:hypothetical protein